MKKQFSQGVTLPGPPFQLEGYTWELEFGQVHLALVGWLRLGDEAARALVVRWVADQKRQGLASATVNRRLASLRWAARLAATGA